MAKALVVYDSATGKTLLLGKINTRTGRLTRVQKLKAVQFTGEWVTI